MRCLTLADELSRGAVVVAFAVNRDATRYAPALERVRYKLHRMDNFANLAAIVEREGVVDVVVFDSYDIDEWLERPLRRRAKKIVVIDDLANRRHDCDLLVDTTFGRDASDYRDLVPPDAKILAGAKYALLRPEFAAQREESLARRKKGGGVERILVSLGLTDIGGITARVVAALLAGPLQAKIDVVVGPDAPSRSALEDMGARDKRLVLHVDPPDMARLMVEADLAIGAGGTTTWERCCLGLPTIVLVLASNQKLIARNLEEAGAVLVTCGAGVPELAELVEKVQDMIDRPAIFCAMSTAAAAIVDGRGAERVRRSIHDGLEQAA